MGYPGSARSRADVRKQRPCRHPAVSFVHSLMPLTRCLGLIVAASVTDASATASPAGMLPLIFRTLNEQALDRTRPVLPIRPGIPKRQTTTTSSWLKLVECFSVITRRAFHRRHLHLCKGADYGDRRLRRPLERPPTPVHSDQGRRRDPRQHPAGEDLKEKTRLHTTSVPARSDGSHTGCHPSHPR
jgi:hypothetical protein